MKPIQLSPEQRQEIDRRRKASHDRRVYERLTAVLAVAAGRTRADVADQLGVSLTQLGDWLRVFRNQGLEALCTLHNKIRHWLEQTVGARYTSSGVKQLLRRIGASYHKVTGFLWKADPDKQYAFVAHYERQKAAARRSGAKRTRRYFVDACHPLWGLELVYACWLLVGQRFLAGMGSGRKRLNILGAYCPDDREYLDLRLTRDNINGEQFVNLLRLLRATHPETERFVLYLDRARYYGSPVVKAWLRRHREFQLEPLPTYSPNLNLIERLWKFLRKRALSRWHPTFEAMQGAVSGVLDHLEDYRAELETLLVEEFHIVEKHEIPVEYREAA